MKDIYDYIPACVSAFFAGWVIWRDKKKDVPESTKSFIEKKINDKIYEHEKDEDKERMIRADGDEYKLVLKIKNCFDEAFKKSECDRKILEIEKTKNRKLELDTIHNSIREIKKEVEKISDQCTFHKIK